MLKLSICGKGAFPHGMGGFQCGMRGFSRAMGRFPRAMGRFSRGMGIAVTTGSNQQCALLADLREWGVFGDTSA